MKFAKLFKKEQMALDHLMTDPLMSKEELGQKLGVSESLAGVYISKLQTKGYIRVEKIIIPYDKEFQVSLV